MMFAWLLFFWDVMQVLYIDRDYIQIDCCSYENATEDSQADSI